MFLLNRLIFLTLVLSSINICNAETIVRLTLQQGGSIDTVDLKLFDIAKSETVSNFMSYADDGSYNDSFIHRSFTLPDIIQGGGFKYDPDNSEFPNPPIEVPNEGSIKNEPGISNLRGTIAMAKLSGLPDSATSQWFINLGDNSALDEPVNNEFTVFGEVLNNGMQVIDSIATLPVVNLGGPFTDIPLVDYLIGDLVLISNIVRVTNVEGLLKISPDHDFGIVTPKSNLQPEFFIENISNQNILIGNVGNSDPVEDPFIILGLRCDNSILQPGDKCAFVVAFNSPENALPATYTDSFNIEFPELGLDYTINITGEGGAEVDEPDISQIFSSSGFRSTDYGDVDIDNSETPAVHFVSLSYQNLGREDLTFSINLVTSQPDEFTMLGDCLDISVLTVSGLDNFCSLALVFTPLSSGKKTATIEISSNDPDEPVFDFTFNATAVAENDGVDGVIENAGPNNGDGNYDGILDSKQSNVVSLPGSNGQYVTLTGSSEIRYRDVHFVDQSTLPPVPANVATSLGVLEFTVTNLGVNENIETGMILPASMNPASYYVFGPNDTNAEPGWFEFSRDNAATTGAEIITGASWLTDEGNVVPATFVKLFLTNGVRGDSDFKADDEIKVTGAFDVPPSGSGGSGQLYIVELCLLLLIMVTCRSNFHCKSCFPRTLGNL